MAHLLNGQQTVDGEDDSWLMFIPDDVTRAPHIIPRNDLRLHDMGHSCWCEPDYDGGQWVHNAADGRGATIEYEH